MSRYPGTLVCLTFVAVASIAALAQPAVAQGTNTTLPLTYPAQILQGDDSQTCPFEAQQERVRNEVDSEILRLVRESVVQAIQTQLPTDPATQPTTRPPTVTGFSCYGSTDWRRVAYLNMSDPSQQCPSVWREYTIPHRVCGRRSNSSTGSCEGLTYSTGSEQYNQVCGRIIGYQLGNTDAFIGSSLSIDTYYVDGVSVTHGIPRQHIWTFSNGLDELSTTYSYATCPCVNGSTNENRIPSFVGQNYFCETGITRWTGPHGILFPDGDPLWDGQGCGPTSSCCTFNSPPWFTVTLSSPITDNIEVRICNRGFTQHTDTPIQLTELYVK